MLIADITKVDPCVFTLNVFISLHPSARALQHSMFDHVICEVLDMTSCILHNVSIGRPSGCSRVYRDTRSMFPAKIKTYMNAMKSSWVISHMQIQLSPNVSETLSSLTTVDIMNDTTTHCIYNHRTFFLAAPTQTRHC
jgi:hypothetical protein